MKIEFKYAELNHLPSIVKTYNDTIPSRMVTADLEPVTVESRVDWLNKHTKDKQPLWVIISDDVYAGWISFKTFYGRPAYDGTIEISIYLEKEFQNKGLGKICLQKAVEESRKLNIHTMLGYIFAHNEISIKLFEKFGFKRWAHFPQVANMEGVMRDLEIWGMKV